MRLCVAGQAELRVGQGLMKAVFHHPAGPWLTERLAAPGEGAHRFTVVAEADGPALDAALGDAEVLLHVLHPVTEAMMAGAPRLRLVQKIGVGLDAIDRHAARARGIAVCNMPGTNTAAVAEMTLGLMLSVLRRIGEQDHAIRRERGWALGAEARETFGEIAGRTVGLVGYGAVARRLATVLRALGAEVIVTARREIEDEGEGVRRVDKAALLAEADIVSLHIPETPDTRGWLDAAAIARMKPGAIVINTARGGLVDEPALVAALESGHLAGAGLDVFGAEPPAPDAPIRTAPNVTATAHTAWLTRETLERSLAVAIENMNRLANGEPLVNRHD